MCVRVKRNPDRMELLNAYRALETAIRVEVEIHRKNYYARLFDDWRNDLRRS